VFEEFMSEQSPLNLFRVNVTEFPLFVDAIVVDAEVK
jgi:hypothetical protein